MNRDRWTILLVKGDDRPVTQFSVSGRLIRVGAWVSGVAALGIFALGIGIGLDGTARWKAMRLEEVNEVLTTELTGFQKRVAQLEGALDEFSENDAHFRSIAGLEAIDSEVLQAGVGGPGLGSPEDSPLWAADSALSKTVFATTYDLSALERRARLLSVSLSEATDSVLAHRDLLESTPSILPTAGWLTSRYSRARVHPIHNRPLAHEGVDISAPKGTPIYAAAKGRVIKAGWEVGYGLTVEVDHGFGFTTLYGHASKLVARVGQEVQRGDVIAQVGSTGIATAAHLHYEVRVNGVAQDPAQFILPTTLRY